MHLFDKREKGREAAVCAGMIQSEVQVTSKELVLMLRSNSSCWKDPCNTEQASLSGGLAALQQLAFAARNRVTTSSRQVYIRQQQATPMQLPCKRSSAPCTVHLHCCLHLAARKGLHEKTLGV